MHQQRGITGSTRQSNILSKMVHLPANPGPISQRNLGGRVFPFKLISITLSISGERRVFWRREGTCLDLLGDARSPMSIHHSQQLKAEVLDQTQ